MEISRRTLIQAAVGTAVLSYPIASQAAVTLKNGSDISWITNYEAAGGKFYTTSGKPVDPFTMLKSAKASVARIRVFVNPTTRNGRLDDAIALASRAKAAGLEVCIDLHFSDTWADPGAQWTPAGWSTTSISLLVEQLAGYTTATLNEFTRRNLKIDYVQLGNEVANGFLWPLGKIDSSTPSQWRNLSSLHNAAANALRQGMPGAKSILHLDCGGDANRTRWWLGLADTYKLRNFDIVGLSYYPQWHGSIKKLTETLEVVSWEFEKKVLIAETAYPYTSQTFGGDVIDPQKSILPGYPLTPSGQAAYLRKLKSIVKALPLGNGVGVWWWEGLAGRVAIPGKPVVDFGMTNSTLIDARSRPLSALAALSG